MLNKKRTSKDVEAILFHGGIGVMPTDTIYGLVGSALLPGTVGRIYRLLKRNLKKPMIVLVSSTSDLKKFGVKLKTSERAFLKKYWSGKVSVIFRVGGKKFKYLHRGGGTVAFRMPRPKRLQALLKAVGPLVAPSANFEGKSPAKTIREAKKYFGKKTDFYLDGGRMDDAPSALVKFEKGKPVILREGKVFDKKR
ncbi:MAG: L-threonylcarbamoyladenylate synthase [Candidatus Liptonbacteria bacterium]|nr:L-threonylcarbamoyladenylate synthase [Candidatus Liptonbacteria bacterium]